MPSCSSIRCKLFGASEAGREGTSQLRKFAGRRGVRDGSAAKSARCAEGRGGVCCGLEGGGGNESSSRDGTKEVWLMEVGAAHALLERAHSTFEARSNVVLLLCKCGVREGLRVICAFVAEERILFLKEREELRRQLGALLVEPGHRRTQDVLQRTRRRRRCRRRGQGVETDGERTATRRGKDRRRCVARRPYVTWRQLFDRIALFHRIKRLDPCSATIGSQVAQSTERVCALALPCAHTRERLKHRKSEAETAALELRPRIPEGLANWLLRDGRAVQTSAVLGYMQFGVAMSAAAGLVGSAVAHIVDAQILPMGCHYFWEGCGPHRGLCRNRQLETAPLIWSNRSWKNWRHSGCERRAQLDQANADADPLHPPWSAACAVD
eukprot:6191051-Pleurochrysis_carterae.AAC.2